MNYKRWVLLFLSITLISLCVFAGFMFIADPLIQFGTESNLFTYYEYSEIYSNPGIAKNYSYDAVMVGTSMIENTDVQECNTLFGCDMVRLPYSGGTSYNMKTILDVCFESENDIKTVYWELDEFQLQSSHTEPRFPLPMYLYGNDNSQVLNYLLNLDIFYHYVVPNISGTLRGEQQMVAREGEMLHGTFSKEEALHMYDRPERSMEQLPQTHYMEQTKLNLYTNILPLVQQHPDTEFVFFIVPFSILYWDAEVQNGSFDAAIYSLEYVIAELLEHDNVRIYFYHDQWDIVTNLDNYKDYSHYASWVNSFMTQAMAAEEGRLTKDSYQTVLDEMRSFIHEYDFESIFS